MIESKKYFYSDYTDFASGECMIRVHTEALPFSHTDGSVNVLAARVMNLSYAQYLRMCRDQFSARLEGKGHKYPVAYFKKGEILDMFLKLLNSRMDYIMRRRDFERRKKEGDFGVIQDNTNGSN